ncbi:MAG: hypothetical protein AAGA76_13660, partial [Pseudomonadota bacterium]
MEHLNDRANSKVALPTPTLVGVSNEELQTSKMQMMQRIAPIAALLQIAFGVWFSLSYASITHVSGLLG